ncbi:chitin binding peritrophin like protein [Dasychira pudibunda nucleopolyhedrovirus]|nr:chitin binding peritrophin like protein [Dasychira pudibunda nucleopolyhedrovirus]WHM28349.1 cbp-1 [Dasychira pudibunda nucleopolyhedrovirus]
MIKTLLILTAVLILLLLAAFAYFAKGHAAEDDVLQRCKDNGGFGNVSSAYCNKFYMCFSDQYVPAYCTAGFAFDEATGHCANAATVDCQGRPLL